MSKLITTPQTSLLKDIVTNLPALVDQVKTATDSEYDALNLVDIYAAKRKELLKGDLENAADVDALLAHDAKVALLPSKVERCGQQKKAAIENLDKRFLQGRHTVLELLKSEQQARMEAIRRKIIGLWDPDYVNNVLLPNSAPAREVAVAAEKIGSDQLPSQGNSIAPLVAAAKALLAGNLP